MAAGSNWTAEENSVLVRAYLDMLRLELTGQAYTKADFRRQVRSLIDRSEGSIEYKLQNVSSALYEINHPFIDGYKPARNLQDALRHAVLRQLDLADDIAHLAFGAVQRGADPPKVDLAWSIEDAPHIEVTPSPTSKHRARRVDFVRIEAENHRLGQAGEIAVLQRERKTLQRVGKSDLAERVEHVSQTVGDGLGFDILSFDERGEEKFIEVKTTRRGKLWPMLISRGEVAFSQEESDRFHLYRVYDFNEKRAGLYVLRGDVARSCHLAPMTYQAMPA